MEAHDIRTPDAAARRRRRGPAGVVPRVRPAAAAERRDHPGRRPRLRRPPQPWPSPVQDPEPGPDGRRGNTAVAFQHPDAAMLPDLLGALDLALPVPQRTD